MLNNYGKLHYTGFITLCLSTVFRVLLFVRPWCEASYMFPIFAKGSVNFLQLCCSNLPEAL